ncbi:MAG: PAC2 family protein [Nitrosopumilaceae archaeon]
MQIQQTQRFKLKDIILISSLPDMGKVGGLVSGHLAKKLTVKPAAKLILSDKPWVNQKNGIVELPREEYNFLVDEQNSIVIFTGENQPQEGRTVYEMSELVLSTVRQMGNIKLVISSGGYMPPKQADGDKVYGIATNTKAFDILKPYGVEALDSEVNSITWFNGLILGHAKAQNIDGVGLFGEIMDVESPQYKAAKNIIKIIEKILDKKIDTSDLEQKVEDVSPEPKKEGPGIG